MTKNWQENIEKQYPTAMTAAGLSEQIKDFCQSLQLNIPKALLAGSFCRDELNRPFIKQLENFFGSQFQLGGLAGNPTAGRTGLTACLSHVPDDGILIIVYGPHIGITATGEWGKNLRHGMQQDTLTCGALQTFLSRIHAQPLYQPQLCLTDVEQYFLEDNLLKDYGQDLKNDPCLHNLTSLAYQLTEKSLHHIMDAVGPTCPVVLFGGILINTPEGDDLFSIKTKSLYKR